MVRTTSAAVVAVLLALAAGCGNDPAPDRPSGAETARQIRGQVDGVVRAVLPDVTRDLRGRFSIGLSGHYVGCGSEPGAAFLATATLRSPVEPAAAYARIRSRLVAAGLRVHSSEGSISARRDGLVVTFFSFTRQREETTGYLEITSRCAALAPPLVAQLEELPEHVYDGLPTDR